MVAIHHYNNYFKLHSSTNKRTIQTPNTECRIHIIYSATHRFHHNNEIFFGYFPKDKNFWINLNGFFGQYLQIQWVKEQYNIFAFILFQFDIFELTINDGCACKWWRWFVQSWHFGLIHFLRLAIRSETKGTNAKNTLLNMKYDWCEMRKMMKWQMFGQNKMNAKEK